MDIPIRPPPKVLRVHDGTDFKAHLKHLIAAGLEMSVARGDHAVAVAIEVQPRLKRQESTKHIPIIAVTEVYTAGEIERANARGMRVGAGEAVSSARPAR